MHSENELAQLGLGVGVVQAEHGYEMSGLGKGREGLAADALGWGGGGDQFGVIFFEIDELAIELVVVEVRDDGLSEDVVAMVVVSDLGYEGGVSLLEIRGSHGFRRREPV